MATARAAGRGLSNVRFVAGDIHDRAPDGPFDAIIGRLVLMYVPDPAAVLRTQAGVLRPGGVDGPAILAGIVRTVLPLIERTGVATAAEVGADTLQQRLSGELAAAAAVFAHPMLISAWGTKRT
jgi:SAM-dependent methyltransferase